MQLNKVKQPLVAALGSWLAIAVTTVHAQAAPVNGGYGPTAVPALDDVGLLGLAVLLAAGGAWLIRKRRK